MLLRLFLLAALALSVRAGTPPPTPPVTPAPSSTCGSWLDDAGAPWLCSDVAQSGAPGQLCAVVDASVQPYACYYTSCAHNALTNRCEGTCASGEICALAAANECACGTAPYVHPAVTAVVIAFGATTIALVLFSCFWTNGLNR